MKINKLGTNECYLMPEEIKVGQKIIYNNRKYIKTEQGNFLDLITGFFLELPATSWTELVMAKRKVTTFDELKDIQFFTVENDPNKEIYLKISAEESVRFSYSSFGHTYLLKDKDKVYAIDDFITINFDFFGAFY